jgi:hypothetical protein
MLYSVVLKAVSHECKITQTQDTKQTDSTAFCIMIAFMIKSEAAQAYNKERAADQGAVSTGRWAFGGHQRYALGCGPETFFKAFFSFFLGHLRAGVFWGKIIHLVAIDLGPINATLNLRHPLKRKRKKRKAPQEKQ